MPRKDGTGPLGQGALTGRGAGVCGTNTLRGGLGLGQGRGYNCRRVNFADTASKEELVKQKEILEARLDEINKQLV